MRPGRGAETVPEQHLCRVELRQPEAVEQVQLRLSHGMLLRQRFLQGQRKALRSQAPLLISPGWLKNEEIKHTDARSRPFHLTLLLMSSVQTMLPKSSGQK
ncbi:hypothetical protein HPB49_019006 [Dermacentor silvarum]|uniref:Uncharacterized protein n=1 Tax=Dermacentor silvarum TaxID=543639 RepID=A0ACB8CSK4_DERSI|nr:hypothetical protein HPB49_019006 [Dermacentor silvarum]